MESNADVDVVRDFGQEWAAFKQDKLSPSELSKIFHDYFEIFPWNSLPADSVGVDVGCGSGRWANQVASRVGKLFALDASHQALDVARQNCKAHPNVEFVLASVDQLPFGENQLDFAYSLGVLHHVPRTEEAICSVHRVLKPGAPFLIYLYYNLDNRPLPFRLLWRATDILRRTISRMNQPLKRVVCDLIAGLVYFPLARLSLLLEQIGHNVHAFPLNYYRNKSFYTMRTDALDRFGTRLEQRFSRLEIARMLERVGFEQVLFSEKPPYWTAVCRKTQQ